MGSAESYARTDPEELGTDGNLPPPDVLTHDVFYGQHTYKLQPKGDCLLTPYVMCGSVEDPLNTNYTDHYIASALRTRADTERPRLNLMLVVDVSGSMNASMRSNWYAQPPPPHHHHTHASFTSTAQQRQSSVL